MLNPEQHAPRPSNSSDAITHGSEALPGQADLSPVPIDKPDFSTESVTPINSLADKIDLITASMPTRGYPELELVWNDCLRQASHLSTLSEDQISNQYERHTAPLMNWSKLALLPSVSLTCAGTWAFISLILPQFSHLSAISQAALIGVTALNYAALSVYTITALQRYIASSFRSAMASQLFSMFTKESYRQYLESTAKAKATMENLAQHGIESSWDDPQYKAYYQLKEGQVVGLQTSPRLLVHKVLQEFLGYKDPQKRKHSPGPFMSDLRDGKKTVTQFVELFKAEIALSREQLLTEEQGLKLLADLHRDFVLPQSRGSAYLERTIEALAKGKFLQGNEIEARVWQRDPWVDLTHQEEFFSSASLRGVKLMGRGPKGRLGTFGYMTNKSICALDFTSQRGRLVRARLGAAQVNGGPLAGRTVLFVDGVEGSNAIPPQVIQKGIEDYARQCGFDAVLYNKLVHNQIPRRFIRHLEKAGPSASELSITYLDAGKREYLDAFGLPLEPFEYTFPRGTVVGYLVELKDKICASATKPRLTTRCLQFLKRNALWLLVGETSLYSTYLVGHTMPEAVIPLVGLTIVGSITHVWYQRRCLKFASE